MKTFLLLCCLALASAVQLRGMKVPSGVPKHHCIQNGKECPDAKAEDRYIGAPTNHPDNHTPRREADNVRNAEARDSRNAGKNAMIADQRAAALIAAEQSKNAQTAAGDQSAETAVANSAASAGKLASKAAAALGFK